MALKPTGFVGVEILATLNDTAKMYMLSGSGEPGGSGGLEDDAGVGSIYLNSLEKRIHIKKTSTNSSDDWFLIADETDISAIKFRSEKVIVATTDVKPANGATIDLSINPFGDDDSPLITAADFAVGQYIIFDTDGTPALMQVTAKPTADEITVNDAIDPLADGDKFVVENYLPDSPDAQEKQALVQYDASVPTILKISDLNWDFADGINLTAGYTAVNGSITSADTVNSAIEKLDGNQQDLITLSGVAQGSVDLGTFTGSNSGEVIQDSRTVKQALQDIEDFINRVYSANAVTTSTVIDSVLVDELRGVEWEVTAELDSDKTRSKMFTVKAIHNGTSGADATTTDWKDGDLLRVGANFDADVTVDLNGTGAAQVMRLNVQASAAVSFRAIRRRRMPVT